MSDGHKQLVFPPTSLQAATFSSSAFRMMKFGFYFEMPVNLEGCIDFTEGNPWPRKQILLYNLYHVQSAALHQVWLSADKLAPG